MIVKHHEEGWNIVSHYAHGLLAGKIASQIEEKLMPENWVDVLTGIVEHDDHMQDFEEKNYLTDAGTPKDFTMNGGSNKDSLEHAQTVFKNAMQKSQLVALLVGRHLEFLHEGLAAEYAPMNSLLDEIAGLRAKQRKLYGLKKADEDLLYDIMLFCDRCSLILCQDEIPEVGRKLEINKTIGDKTYYIHKNENTVLTIEPWPFEKNQFELTFEYRVLKRVKFKNNADLKASLDAAEVRLKNFSIKK